MPLIPWLDLEPTLQHDVITWLNIHRVDPGRVPLEAVFEYDAAADEWRIPVHWVDANGHKRLDETGEDVRQHVIRRRPLGPLPWPEASDA